MKLSKKTSYILMAILIFVWGLDFIATKVALTEITPLTLMYFKYVIALSIVYILKCFKDKDASMQKKDLPTFFLCAIFGEIAYFGLEYNAMSFVTLSVISVILSTVPIISILAEAVLFKRAITLMMVFGSVLSVIGVLFIIGADCKELFSGKIIGYILAFGAVLCWTAYNFITDSLHDRYSSISIYFYQTLIVIILLTPYAMTHLPAHISLRTLLLLVYIGAITTGFGGVIYVIALNVVGVTPTSLFSNFLPLSTTLLAWIFLAEKISYIQVFGGVLTIVATCIVVIEKDRIGKLIANS